MKFMQELSVNERDLATEVKVFSKLKLLTLGLNLVNNVL